MDEIVTEDDVRILLNNFKGFVKEIVAYKEHIEVNFQCVFLLKNNEEVDVVSKIERGDLYK